MALTSGSTSLTRGRSSCPCPAPATDCRQDANFKSTGIGSRIPMLASYAWKPGCQHLNTYPNAILASDIHAFAGSITIFAGKTSCLLVKSTFSLVKSPHVPSLIGAWLFPSFFHEPGPLPRRRVRSGRRLCLAESGGAIQCDPPCIHQWLSKDIQQ